MDLLKRFTLWPFTHFFEFLTFSNRKNQKINDVAIPYVSDPCTFIIKVMAMVPLCLITWICFQFDPLQAQMKEAHTLGFWVWRIIIRDLLLLAILGGGWQLVIFYSCMTQKLHPLKYNQKYADPRTNLPRQILLSVSTTLMGSFFEVLALYLYANGKITNYYLDFFEYPLFSFCWVFLMPFWRDGHFYWIHRAMHPWNKPGIPDLGKFLYKHVHSHHHKSYNPTALSGISMHPVEGFIYETAAVLPCLFFHHPALVLLIKIQLGVFAFLGHDGHDNPGGAALAHYLHHANFDCNYGSENAPFDWLFGTFDDGSGKYAKKLKN